MKKKLLVLTVLAIPLLTAAKPAAKPRNDSQALAYKIGIERDLGPAPEGRAGAGAKFDVRRFHDAMLGSGAMPMTVLRKHVDWWIDQEKGRAR